MKKFQLLRSFIAPQLFKLRCPTCHDNFAKITETALVCVNGHSFDISKKGSLFFLRTPVKTEYTQKMLVQRQEIIKAGLFTPVLNQLVDLLSGTDVIDAGCGEGSQIKMIADHRVGNYFAFDISKPAIELAVSGPDFQQNTAFFVADLAQMPFSDHQFSDVINFLSPANYQEFQRVLNANGQVLKVMPNHEYLKELRHLLYPTGVHASYDPTQVISHFQQQFQHSRLIPVHYRFNLTPSLARALFVMTPLSWKFAQEPENIDLNSLTQITIDLVIGQASF